MCFFFFNDTATTEIYTLSLHDALPICGFGALARYDFATGSVAVRDFGPGREVDEPVFVPRPGAAEEGDGWVMAYVYDRASDGSVCVLLDARDIGRAPVAEIAMSRRVPHGLHGNWMPA